MLRKPNRLVFFSTIVWIAVLASAAASACSYDTAQEADDWINLATSGEGADFETFDAHVDGLRELGSGAIEALVRRQPAADSQQSQGWNRLLDRVCGQHDCASSRLFWHTDLDRAKEEASERGLPILSLRLLGRLDEEMSCANSRFFRKVLYPDPTVNALLRQRFVLHWQSERPVPVVTIDFGDGRRLDGTITGNSVHYVLDARGRVVDVVPGLYSAGIFVEALEQAAITAHDLTALDDEAYLKALRRAHRAALEQVDRNLADIGGVQAMLAAAPKPDDRMASAREATAMAMTKLVVEKPVLEAVGIDADAAVAGIDWQAVAQRRPDSGRLSAPSRQLLLDEYPMNWELDQMVKMIAFEQLLAEDTTRNEYLLRTVARDWIVNSTLQDMDLETFNRRIYSELFLTPGHDPWLGLRSVDTFTALAPTTAVHEPEVVQASWSVD